MPTFHDTTATEAPPAAVWKLLYDPSRFPDWWDGLASVELSDEPSRFTLYPDGYPDFPMAQQIESRAEQGRVVVSCLAFDLRFRWLLAAGPDGGTRVSVDVDVPDAEAHRLDDQRRAIAASLRRLTALAAEEAGATAAPRARG